MKRYPHVCENPECGKQFFGRKNARFCSDKCRCRAGYLSRRGYRKMADYRRSESAQFKVKTESLLKRRKREREEMRQRLAQRDALYAAHAAPVTVEERGGVRIETRGQMCIGWRSSDKVRHI